MVGLTMMSTVVVKHGGQVRSGPGAGSMRGVGGTRGLRVTHSAGWGGACRPRGGRQALGVVAAVPVPGLSNETNADTLPFRVGHGFDLHRLEPDLPCIVGGIKLEHTHGCAAHSDGDVLLHTLTDTILGALALPDIGQIFPDNDPKWKGQTSDVFIKEAVRLMREKGYAIGNIDATLILQRPKVSPHKDAIKSNVCRLLEIDESRFNLKAKTHEKVDSIGEGRSVACHAVGMLYKVN